ncbi:MAG: hypothetical protein ACRDKB_10830 [Actinomycetota bacterium]
MIQDVSRRDKRHAFLAAIGLALVVMLIGAPVVEAAIQRVRVKGSVKVKDTSGDALDSKAIPAMGLFGAEGSSGALAVRTFGGGGGFLGAADCDGVPANLPGSVAVSNKIVTGIIITGTGGTFTVTSDAIGGGALPLLNFSVTADNPNVFVGLGNGLTLTDALTFTCTAGTNANLVVLGQ